jgi:hypothetical protein
VYDESSGKAGKVGWQFRHITTAYSPERPQELPKNGRKMTGNMVEAGGVGIKLASDIA